MSLETHSLTRRITMLELEQLLAEGEAAMPQVSFKGTPLTVVVIESVGDDNFYNLRWEEAEYTWDGHVYRCGSTTLTRGTFNRGLDYRQTLRKNGLL